MLVCDTQTPQTNSFTGSGRGSFAFCPHRRNDPDLDAGIDFAVEVDFDGVQSQLLERTFQADLVFREMNVDGLQRVHDLVRTNAAVQVAFVVGVGFDGDRLLGQGVGLLLIALQFLKLDFTQLLTVLIDHSLVVVGRDGREALWKQVIEGKASLDLNEFTLASQVFHVVNQEQLDAPVGPFGQSLELAVGSTACCLAHDRWRSLRESSKVVVRRVLETGIFF